MKKNKIVIRFKNVLYNNVQFRSYSFACDAIMKQQYLQVRTIYLSSFLKYEQKIEKYQNCSMYLACNYLLYQFTKY